MLVPTRKSMGSRAPRARRARRAGPGRGPRRRSAPRRSSGAGSPAWNRCAVAQVARRAQGRELGEHVRRQAGEQRRAGQDVADPGLHRASLPETVRWMRAALSIAFYALVFASFPVFFAGALALFLITAPFDRRRVLLHLYACFWSCSYFYVHPRWRVRVVGRRRLPWRGAAVIVANHQSLVDFLVLGALYRPFRWVAKAEVFRVPFVGWTMRLAGHVGLERGAGGS